MDSETLVRYMMKLAKKDVLGGKGRIFISELHSELPNEEKPTPEEMLRVWRKAYPDIPIVWFSKNLFTVLFGKAITTVVEEKVELVEEECVCDQ